MRFDDSLKTVLAADATTAFGAQATFRQLADLIARGRVAADEETLGRLRLLRDQVPVNVRAAVARSLALGQPPEALIALFAEDEPGVASAALRAARLSSAQWISLIPQLGPSGRAALRRREDLGTDVERALASFGSTDFTLAYTPAPSAIPVVDEARDAADPAPAAPGLENAADPVELSATDRQLTGTGGFDIAELVDRIANFQQQRAVPAPVTAAPAIDHFRFQTDADGTIRWTDGAPRGALIGLRLVSNQAGEGAQVDGIVLGAFRGRTGFTNARLVLDGGERVAGEWRISGVPLFDPAGGQFIGYQGAAHRPRIDQTAAPVADRGNAEGLRRLVHELRTPTNAIAGFSELIETQLLGPVAPPYRERAAAIRVLAADLVAAIEDLDLAARIEGHALELRPDVVDLGRLLQRITADVQGLAALRDCTVDLAPIDGTPALACDERATERLLGRLIATLVSAAQGGEVIAVSVSWNGLAEASVSMTYPQALASLPADRLLNLDVEGESQMPGAPLLGTGFALRLSFSLASQLGGRLTLAPDHVTVTLPAAIGAMGQAIAN
ncbi:Signal transduction histidine kinase [Sphingomonas sp. OV641]|uniref:sensor histidine kinase n=1 Tax=Sphingomonas sp. OV641 TaxID=1881068 RepID=UPI0008C01C68|nr:HAMP domain-containing sensor histidine kinase [Sphingomonas sp. OV641]SEJ21797.1 Signal transduction histidine kinase [Sphingomonas sp. OV641]